MRILHVLSGLLANWAIRLASGLYAPGIGA